jgi:MFS transporter, DHA1 family, putative efflux transporter
MAIDNKNSEKLIWLLAACCFVLGSTQQYIMGVPDQVAETLGVSLGQVSLLMTAFGLINAFFAPVIVVVTAKFPARKQLMIGLAFIIAGLLITAFAKSFALQLVARGLMGMGNGSFVATAYAASQKLAKPGKQATAMANVALGFSAASVLAMPIARALRDVINWQSAYLVLAVLAVLAMLVLAKFFPNTEPDNASDSIKDRLAPLANKSVLFAYFATALMFVSYSGFYTYVTPFLDSMLPECTDYTSLILFVLGLMSLVGTKGCGWLADRSSLRTALLFSLCGQAVMLVAVFFAECAGLGLIPVLCLFQMVAWMLVPIQNTFLSQAAGDGARMAIALSSSFLQLGNACGAALAGAAISSVPYSVLPLMAAPFTLVALTSELFAFHLYKKNKAVSE